MKNKPDPAKMISYLYGEMGGEEKIEFETLLAESPELAEELQETRQLLGSLHPLPEVESPPPPVLLAPDAYLIPKSPQPTPRWVGSRLAQSVLAIAAGLSLLLVAGALTEVQFTLNREGVALRFGQETPVKDEQSEELITLVNGLREEVRTLKSADPQTEANRFHQELAGLKKTLTELNQRVEAQAKRQQVQMIAGKPRRQLSDTQMNRLLTTLSDENLRLIEAAFQAANEQQQRQLQESLSNFTRYLDKIRAEDTELVLASIEELDRRAESKFRETDQAIGELLQTVQTQNPN